MPEPISTALSASSVALAFAKALKDAKVAKDEAAVLRAHIGLLDKYGEAMIAENRDLRRDLEKAKDVVNRLTKEIRENKRRSEDDYLEDLPFKALCLIYEADGQVTDEVIREKLRIKQPDVNWCINQLWSNSLISMPGDRLDDPPGYNILPDGTGYLRRFRALREADEKEPS